jgi:hypothetical protein
LLRSDCDTKSAAEHVTIDCSAGTSPAFGQVRLKSLYVDESVAPVGIAASQTVTSIAICPLTAMVLRYPLTLLVDVCALHLLLPRKSPQLAYLDAVHNPFDAGRQ